MDVEIVTV